jgi:hypothetical protein
MRSRTIRRQRDFLEGVAGDAGHAVEAAQRLVDEGVVGGEQGFDAAARLEGVGEELPRLFAHRIALGVGEVVGVVVLGLGGQAFDVDPALDEVRERAAPGVAGEQALGLSIELCGRSELVVARGGHQHVVGRAIGEQVGELARDLEGLQAELPCLPGHPDLAAIEHVGRLQHRRRDDLGAGGEVAVRELLEEGVVARDLGFAQIFSIGFEPQVLDERAAAVRIASVGAVVAEGVEAPVVLGPGGDGFGVVHQQLGVEVADDERVGVDAEAVDGGVGQRLLIGHVAPEQAHERVAILGGGEAPQQLGPRRGAVGERSAGRGEARVAAARNVARSVGNGPIAGASAAGAADGHVHAGAGIGELGGAARARQRGSEHRHRKGLGKHSTHHENLSRKDESSLAARPSMPIAAIRDTKRGETYASSAAAMTQPPCNITSTKRAARPRR